MKALVVKSPGNLLLAEREEPVANADEAMVAPLMAGMCGTDLD